MVEMIEGVDPASISYELLKKYDMYRAQSQEPLSVELVRKNCTAAAGLCEWVLNTISHARGIINGGDQADYFQGMREDFLKASNAGKQLCFNLGKEIIDWNMCKDACFPTEDLF